MFYLQQAVHVRLHVGDGHPLHDDVTDTPLQRLPFGAGGSIVVSVAPPNRGAPDRKRNSVSALKASICVCVRETLCFCTGTWFRSKRSDPMFAAFQGFLSVRAPGESQVSSPSCSPSQTWV